MRVSRHAEATLVALTAKMPMPASVIMDRLRKMEAPSTSTALEVCRMTIALARGRGDVSNGDSVVVIIRAGEVVTAMLRRSDAMLLCQPFTPAALRVEAVAVWKWEEGAWTA